MLDISEFDHFVEQYSDSLLQYCYYRLNHNKALVQETYDDILTVIFQKWDTLDFNRNIKAWMIRVADNCIKHNLAEEKKYYDKNVSLEDTIEHGSYSAIASFDTYFKEEYADDVENLYKIRERLPREYREIFTHRYIEKKTIVQTSKLVGIPYSSLRLRLDKMEPIIRAEIKKLFN